MFRTNFNQTQAFPGQVINTHIATPADATGLKAFLAYGAATLLAVLAYAFLRFATIGQETSPMVGAMLAFFYNLPPDTAIAMGAVCAFLAIAALWWGAIVLPPKTTDNGKYALALCAILFALGAVLVEARRNAFVAIVQEPPAEPTPPQDEPGYYYEDRPQTPHGSQSLPNNRFGR